ncbi:MAG: sirohydrochlorin cobaltochelatase [Desulfobacca sp.]|uniref:sirohydrochlorin cobaltochelatase n=1 Tax=Desulfobacca sp. TaxID=2067990 RepID=UPI004049B145
MKPPIVLTAFGTTTRAGQRYALFEERLRFAFPGHSLYWAFSSRQVRHFAKQRQGHEHRGPVEVLRALEQAGHDWAVVQSLHLLAGHEFYRLVEEVQSVPLRTAIGLPLLYAPEDYQALAAILAAALEDVDADETVVLVGHGTDHASWTTYLALQHFLAERLPYPVFVGVLQGYPERQDVVAAVAASGVRRVRLVPLMLVAGVHVQKDLAGEQDSWCQALNAVGLQVTLASQGLLDYPGVFHLFQEHIAEALDAIPHTELCCEAKKSAMLRCSQPL